MILLSFKIMREELTYADNVYIGFLSFKAHGKRTVNLDGSDRFSDTSVCGGRRRTGRFLGW